MTGVLRDLSPQPLVAAIEENQSSFFPSFAGVPGVDVHEEHDLLWFVTGLPVAFMNGVARARLDPEGADGRIEEVVSVFRSRGLPMQWMVGPTSRPSDLGPRLEAHGLTPTHALPMMALDIQAADLEPAAVPGLSIEPVTDREARAEWLRPFGLAFEMPGPTIAAFSHLFLALPSGRATPMDSYIGRLDGRAVATATVLYARGVAGLYNVGVVPEARRRGIGAAMTLVALGEARGRGYRVGVLGAATEIAERLYRGLGFREVCSLLHYT